MNMTFELTIQNTSLNLQRKIKKKKKKDNDVGQKWPIKSRVELKWLLSFYCSFLSLFLFHFLLNLYFLHFLSIPPLLKVFVEKKTEYLASMFEMFPMLFCVFSPWSQNNLWWHWTACADTHTHTHKHKKKYHTQNIC